MNTKNFKKGELQCFCFVLCFALCSKKKPLIGHPLKAPNKVISRPRRPNFTVFGRGMFWIFFGCEGEVSAPVSPVPAPLNPAQSKISHFFPLPTLFFVFSQISGEKKTRNVGPQPDLRRPDRGPLHFFSMASSFPDRAFLCCAFALLLCALALCFCFVFCCAVHEPETSVGNLNKVPDLCEPKPKKHQVVRKTVGKKKSWVEKKKPSWIEKRLKKKM